MHCERMIPRTTYDNWGGFCKEKHRNEWSVVILTPPYPPRWQRPNVMLIWQSGMQGSISISISIADSNGHLIALCFRELDQDAPVKGGEGS